MSQQKKVYFLIFFNLFVKALLVDYYLICLGKVSQGYGYKQRKKSFKKCVCSGTMQIRLSFKYIIHYIFNSKSQNFNNLTHNLTFQKKCKQFFVMQISTKINIEVLFYYCTLNYKIVIFYHIANKNNLFLSINVAMYHECKLV